MKKNSRSKLNKGKTLGIVAATLATISLAGVGYASWTIADNGKKTDTGKVTVGVGDVIDGRTVSMDNVTMSDGTLSFVASGKQTTLSDGKKYIFTGNPSKEDLTFKVKFSVTTSLLKKATDFLTIQFGYKIQNYDANATSGISYCIKTGYIKSAQSVTDEDGIGTTKYAVQEKTITEWTDNKDGTYTSTALCETSFSFAWGSYFNNKNPFVLVSGDAGNKHNDNDIIKGLKEFHDQINNTNFNVDLKISKVDTDINA